jgi:hypothetical protein
MARALPESFVKHVIQLMGGNEKAWQTLDADFEMITSRWEQDTSAIARILRAHLFVEHFLSEFIQARNPDLGSLDEARITFAQKVSLVGIGTPGMAHLLPGLRRLNSIRNRLAHSLRAEVTKEDGEVFLAIGPFRALRDEMAKQATPSNDSIAILEGFAMHAGAILHSIASDTGKVFAEAMRLAEEESSGGK